MLYVDFLLLPWVHVASKWHVRLYYNIEHVTTYNASQRALLAGTEYILSLGASFRPSQQTQHLASSRVAQLLRTAKEEIMRLLHQDSKLHNSTAGFWTSSQEHGVAMSVKLDMPVFMCSRVQAEHVGVAVRSGQQLRAT